MVRAFAIALAVVLLAAPARADTTSGLANLFALEQLIDASQTDRMLHEERCTVYRDVANPVAQRVCTPVFVEGDPFARPFTHSLAEEIAAGSLLNVGMRTVGKRNTVARYVLGVATLVYPFLLSRNAHELRASLSVRF